MRMRFSRRTRFLSPWRAFVIALVGLVLIVLLILRIFFPGALVAAVAPLFSLGDALSSAVRLPEDSAALSRRADALARENAALSAENATLSAQLQDLHAAAKGKGVMAGVIARPPQSPYDALIVAAGTNDGVYAGMRVLSGGVPVGAVESVSAGSARVSLYSSAGSDTSAWAGDTRVPVTLHGEGAGAYSADVPKDAPLKEGDLVYIPGPGALPVGSINAITVDPSSPRAVLHIRPAANPFSMTWVEIVPNPSP